MTALEKIAETWPLVAADSKNYKNELLSILNGEEYISSLQRIKRQKKRTS